MIEQIKNIAIINKSQTVNICSAPMYVKEKNNIEIFNKKITL